MTDNKAASDASPQPQAEQQRGPWRQKSSERVYNNPWLTLTHDEVITPAGTEGIYGVVHFHHTAVGVVALDEHDNIVMVRQFRYALNQNSWEIPEGGCADSETHLTCAQRELQEEAGLSASHWQPLLQLHTSNSVTDESAVVFLARGFSAVEQSLEASESDLIVERFTLPKALAMIDGGDITDAISVAAILKVARLLNC